MAEASWRLLSGSFPPLERLKAAGEKCPTEIDSKNILAIREDTVIVWNSGDQCLLTFSLNVDELDHQHHAYQSLLPTTRPLFNVENVLLGSSGHLLILSGKQGVMVLELPRRWGKNGLFEGGKEKIICRSWSIAERFFVCNRRVTVMQVSWHPGSDSDTHLVILSSDSYLRIYNVADPYTPEQVVALGEYLQSYFLASDTPITFSASLGESAISFDFGQPCWPTWSLPRKPKEEHVSRKDMLWPIFVLKGSGDVYLVYTSLQKTRTQPPQVHGPLVMHPPADDNYGVDACSLLCLPCNPPVLAIAMSSGIIYHCIVLSSGAKDDDSHSDLSWAPENSTITEKGPDVTLYVYESVELELSFAPPQLEDSDPSYRLRLYKDHIASRYHCSHSSGLHTVLLPVVEELQHFASADDRFIVPSLKDQECIVEHLLCTQPFPSSPPSPVLGLVTIINHLGSSVIALLSTWDLVRLNMNPYSQMSSSLLTCQAGQSSSSPLSGKNHGFERVIQQLLSKPGTIPLLKSTVSPDSEPTPQRSLEVLCKAIQQLTEYYIQRVEVAQRHIERRVTALQDQKEQHLRDLKLMLLQSDTLQNGSERLAEKCEDIIARQQQLIQRLKRVLHQLEHRRTVLTDAEVAMHKELQEIQTQLPNFSNSLEQIRIKEEYQMESVSRQETAFGDSSQTPAPYRTNKCTLSDTQLKLVKEILGEETNSLTQLMKNMKWLKKETE